MIFTCHQLLVDIMGSGGLLQDFWTVTSLQANHSEGQTALQTLLGTVTAWVSVYSTTPFSGCWNLHIGTAKITAQEMKVTRLTVEW